MEDYEVLRNLTIGQYLPGRSIIHGLDPRAKIVAAMALIAAITTVGSYLGHLALLAVLVLLISTAGIPLRFALGGLRPALGMIVLLAVMQVLFYRAYAGAGSGAAEAGTALWQMGPLSLSFAGVGLAGLTMLKLVEMMLAVSLLTLTTSTTALSRGMESLLSPLGRIGLPAHEIAMSTTIALRFVPTLAEELEKIAKAQASRGAGFGSRGRWRFVQRLRRLVPLMVPLFVTSFRRAEELVLAMEARCYSGGRGRSSYRRLRATGWDLAAVGVAIALAGVLVVAPFPV